MVTCMTRGIYPRNTVQFSLVSGNTEVVTLRDATEISETSGTFTEAMTVSVEFIRDYNSNLLKCKASYAGPGYNGIHDSDVASQEELNVLVTCKFVFRLYLQLDFLQ